MNLNNNEESRTFRLHKKDGSALDIKLVAGQIRRIGAALGYDGEFLYFPVKEDIMILAQPSSETESRMMWLLQTLCGDLSAYLYDDAGTNIFKSSPDSDADFLDASSFSFAEELEPIRLRCAIEGVSDINASKVIENALVDTMELYHDESDGYSLRYTSTLYFDIYYRPGEDTISFDMEAGFAGAHYFTEAYRLAEKIAKKLGRELTCRDPWSIHLQNGGDHDTLRKAFYPPLKQVLQYAVQDDRDGFQPYVNWLADTFEVPEIPGTIATSYGRYDIKTLISEIEDYGFSWVADHYFLADNFVNESSDCAVKKVLFDAWMDVLGTELKKGGIQETAMFFTDSVKLSNLIRKEPTTPIPRALYKRISRAVLIGSEDISHAIEYRVHAEPGYRRGDLYFGFGKYLRRFCMPGSIDIGEFQAGESVGFTNRSKEDDYFAIEAAIYFYDDEEEACFPADFGSGFAVGDEQAFDIGGSAVCRFIDGGFVKGRWRAEAAILIREELYRFAIAAGSHDTITLLYDKLKNCRAMDDWYDEMEPDPDLHAPGGTFYIPSDAHLDDPFKKKFPARLKYLNHSDITSPDSFINFRVEPDDPDGE